MGGIERNVDDRSDTLKRRCVWKKETRRRLPILDTIFCPWIDLHVRFCPLHIPHISSVALEPYLLSQPIGMQVPLIHTSRVSSSRPQGVPSSTRSLKMNDRSRGSSDTLQISLHRSDASTKFESRHVETHEVSLLPAIFDGVQWHMQLTVIPCSTAVAAQKDTAATPILDSPLYFGSKRTPTGSDRSMV